MVQIDVYRMAVPGPDTIAADLISLLGIGLDQGNDQVLARPAMPGCHHLSELSQIHPPMGVHLQAQVCREVSQAACYQPSQLLCLGFV